MSKVAQAPRKGAGKAPKKAPRDLPAPAGVIDKSSLRMGLFVAGLVFALIGGFGLGRLVSDDTTTPAVAPQPGGAATADPNDHTHAPGTAAHDHGAGGTTSRAGADVGGLSLSGNGFTLVPAATSFHVGAAADFRFTIEGAGREPVTNFAIVHEKPLHMIVARRDLSGYQHIHPTMAPDGTWSVPLTLGVPGIWRAYADFSAAGANGQQLPTTLGVDLVVNGGYTPRPLPQPAREAAVGEFTVTYEGTPTTGATQPLQFRVFQNGTPAALQPYLGALGHLVVLREGDMGYLHVHPDDQQVPGTVKFWLTAPSPGTYRMFFDFQMEGKVHTAELTMQVS